MRGKVTKASLFNLHSLGDGTRHASLKGVMSFLKWEIPRGNSNQPGQRFDMLRGVSYVRTYSRANAQKSRQKLFS